MPVRKSCEPEKAEGEIDVKCVLRTWRISDAGALAAILNNRKIQNNLRDGLPYPIRRLSQEEIPAALTLCWRVFLEYEAPEYPPEGVAFFRANLDDRERTRKLDFYGKFDEETLVGVLCMRAPQHIGGFFVDGAYHRRGIGRRLFETMRRDYDRQVFTVNASPYAVEVYRHLGFVPTDTEQLTDGLRYTPMRYEGENRRSRNRSIWGQTDGYSGYSVGKGCQGKLCPLFAAGAAGR